MFNHQIDTIDKQHVAMHNQVPTPRQRSFAKVALLMPFEVRQFLAAAGTVDCRFFPALALDFFLRRPTISIVRTGHGYFNIERNVQQDLLALPIQTKTSNPWFNACTSAEDCR